MASGLAFMNSLYTNPAVHLYFCTAIIPFIMVSEKVKGLLLLDSLKISPGHEELMTSVIYRVSQKKTLLNILPNKKM